MTNLEGIARNLLRQQKSREEIIEHLISEYKIFKTTSSEYIRQFAEAIIDEVQISEKIIKDAENRKKISQSEIYDEIISPIQTGISMGEGGVGCRGEGDNIIHHYLSTISRTTNTPYISPLSLDDAGAVKIKINLTNFKDLDNSEGYDFSEISINKDIEKRKKAKKSFEQSSNNTIIVVSKMEGMHSRLSDFPFLAGFHVTRAMLRDLYVKGAQPISIMVDVHLADDGDIGKLLDFQAGIATVAELVNVPITAGSTLRIGGDMVIGDRLTGGIAGIGIMKCSYFRKNIQAGDTMIMTMGSGGGTICTTALYHGHPEIVKETLNISFIEAVKTIYQNSEICNRVHAMIDITNGGLRNDLLEIHTVTSLGFDVNLENVRQMVNPKILTLLADASVDYLGVSLDSLLIFCEDSVKLTIIQKLHEKGIEAKEIGRVQESDKIIFHQRNKREIIKPNFRESAYTSVKKVIEKNGNEPKNYTNLVEKAYQRAQEKKKAVINHIRNNI
ncbi:AIR synthase-related protein [Candidatus Harpocratesius sp.]